MRLAISLLLMCFAAAAVAQYKTHPSAPVATKMRESAERFLAALPDRLRTQATRPFDDRDRVDWHYTPRSRNGVSLKELDAKGREAVHALLKTALSVPGYQKVVNIIELELVLVELDAPRTPAAELALDGVLASAGGERLSTDADTWRARLTASPDTIDRALDALRDHGLRSLVRAGAVAMAANLANPPSNENGAPRT